MDSNAGSALAFQGGIEEGRGAAQSLTSTCSESKTFDWKSLIQKAIIYIVEIYERDGSNVSKSDCTLRLYRKQIEFADSKKRW